MALYKRGLPPSLSHYLPYPKESGLGKAVGRKDLFQSWCDAENIPTPLTRLVHSWEELTLAAQETGWPCFLKRSAGSGGTTVFKLDSEEGALAFRPQLASGDTWLVQKMVSGKAGCVLFFADRGEVRAWFGFEFRICLNQGKGPMVLGDFVSNATLAALCRQVAKSSGITGLTGFDFMETEAREYQVIDSHLGRTTAANHFGKWCGVNFGEAIRRWLEGEADFSVEPTPSPTQVIKFPEVIDLLFQQGPFAFRDHLTTAKNTRVAWGAASDKWLMAEMAWSTLIGNLRVIGGRWHRRLIS